MVQAASLIARPPLSREPALRDMPSAKSRDTEERMILEHVVQNADILDLTTDGMSAAESRYDREATRWLLVPIPARLLRVLELLGADLADLEPDADDEVSLGASADTDQSFWAVGNTGFEPDREDDGTDDEDDGIDEFSDVRPEAMSRVGFDDSLRPSRPQFGRRPQRR